MVVVMEERRRQFHQLAAEDMVAKAMEVAVTAAEEDMVVRVMEGKRLAVAAVEDMVVRMMGEGQVVDMVRLIN